MDFKRLIVLGVIGGIVMNVCDIVVQGILLAGWYTGEVFRDPNDVIVWLILVDFVAAFVFVWLYLKLGSAAGAGMRGAILFGAYAGVLYSFPMYFAMGLLFKGVPWMLSVIDTVYGVAQYTVLGTVVGTVDARMKRAA